VDLDFLRKHYLCLLVEAVGVSGNKIGEGRRLCFLEMSDGKTVKVISTTGVSYTLRREEIRLLEVLNRKGVVVSHRFSEAGHLMVTGASGAEMDYGPWQQYERSAKIKKEESTRSRDILPTGGWV
jgi:hypothetical protein